MKQFTVFFGLGDFITVWGASEAKVREAFPTAERVYENGPTY